MLAGLSLITSHTKAYAQQNCPMVDNSRGDVVDEPIVCDGRSGGKGMLNTSRGGSGNEIKMEIKMDMHPSAEAAVTVTGSGTNIIATKKLMVTVTKWSGKNLPVIKVDKGGKLILDGGVEVDVTGAGVTGMKKVIEVNGGETLMLMGESKITIKGDGSGGNGKVVGVQMGSMEKLVMMRNVTFEGVTEGININGSKEGVMVMGLGMGLEKTTMTVKNSGSVGIKVEDTGTIDATVMRLKIVGSGTGSGSKGVEFKGTGKGGRWC
ncbi:hypothetical protein [Bartonella bovis]|nr:hypothetical protein [Bartonella bovis]